jgi:uncharacterized membrane protein
MSWLGLLVLVHVLSAIVGVGPTFFWHVLMRKNQSVKELRASLDMAHRLDIFPKIGGTLAVITGLLLVAFGDLNLDYSQFFQELWLIGTLVLYIYIQVLVIGFIAPLSKRLGSWFQAPENADAEQLPHEQEQQYLRINHLFWAVSAGGILIFIFMISKPIVF